jgi:hypothetical protein
MVQKDFVVTKGLSCFRMIIMTGLVLSILAISACGGKGKSYYVSAAGDDTNKGLSEKAAFKTLHRAVEAVAADTAINTITIVGALTPSTEGDAGNEYNLFRVADSGAEEVTITGIKNATLSGTGSDKNLISFIGLTKVRLENIAFTNSDGIGLNVAEGATVTMGKGVIVSGSKSTGVLVHDTATFIMEDGEISGNGGWRNDYDLYGGGIYISEGGTALMSGGKITKHEGVNLSGGGVYIDYGGTFTLSGGEITGNTAFDAGGGVYVGNGIFTMSGGEITGNKTAYMYGSGGGVFVLSGNFTMSGGLISGNEATSLGGGVRIESDMGLFTMSGGKIINNIGGNVVGSYDNTDGEIGEDAPAAPAGGTFTIEQLTQAVISTIRIADDPYDTTGLTLEKTGNNTYVGKVTHYVTNETLDVVVTVNNGPYDFTLKFVK